MIKIIKLVIPKIEEMSFRESLLSDEDTMSYNHKWGGTISFPKSRWKDWYARWILYQDNNRFYAYLFSEELNCYVGETAYHYVEKENIHITDVIIHSRYRHQGFGREALRLLCLKAKENNLTTLYDDIAIDNPSIQMFLNYGFKEVSRNTDAVLVKKVL